MTKVQVEFDVPMAFIYDMVITAIEQGDSLALAEGDWEAAWKAADQPDPEEAFRHIYVYDRYEDKRYGTRYRLTDDFLAAGFKTFADTAPFNLLDVLRNGHGDAFDADIFMQCACFGDVIYG